MATHSTILAGNIPWVEEPGRIQSVHKFIESRTLLSPHTQLLNHALFLFFLSFQLSINFTFRKNLRIVQQICNFSKFNFSLYLHYPSLAFFLSTYTHTGTLFIYIYIYIYLCVIYIYICVYLIQILSIDSILLLLNRYNS